jgi:hypothetical protein
LGRSVAHVLLLHRNLINAPFLADFLLWALARLQGIPGLRSPEEDDVYEKPILDRLHL